MIPDAARGGVSSGILPGDGTPERRCRARIFAAWKFRAAGTDLRLALGARPRLVGSYPETSGMELTGSLVIYSAVTRYQSFPERDQAREALGPRN